MEIDISFLSEFGTNLNHKIIGGIAIFAPIVLVFLVFSYRFLRHVKPLRRLIGAFFISVLMSFIIGIFPLIIIGTSGIEKKKIIIAAFIIFLGYFTFCLLYLPKIKQFLKELPAAKTK